MCIIFPMFCAFLVFIIGWVGVGDKFCQTSHPKNNLISKYAPGPTVSLRENAIRKTKIAKRLKKRKEELYIKKKNCNRKKRINM